MFDLIWFDLIWFNINELGVNVKKTRFLCFFSIISGWLLYTDSVKSNWNFPYYQCSRNLCFQYQKNHEMRVIGIIFLEQSFISTVAPIFGCVIWLKNKEILLHLILPGVVSLLRIQIINSIFTCVVMAWNYRSKKV